MEGREKKMEGGEIDSGAGEIEYMRGEKVIKVDCGQVGEGSCLRE